MATSKQYPKMVMVIRHGEKPGDPDNDKDGGPHLSILGSARAAALPSLFTPAPNGSTVNGLHQLAADLSIGKKKVHFTGTYSSTVAEAGGPRFPTPDFLFATKPDEGSHRPFETVKPLAAALQCFDNSKFKIKHKKFTNDDPGIEALISEIRDKGVYAGKVILICWHHGKIPKLVEKLGVDASQLPWSKWPSDVFDLIFCITWQDGQANLVVGHQVLLHGDSCDSRFTSGSVTLTLDAPHTLPVLDDAALPTNLRSMNLLPVAGNRASGSAQFSPAQLQNMISQGHVQTPLTVIDLRQESHGFLRLQNPPNDPSEVAVSWFVERDWINVAKGYVSVKADEVQKLKEAAHSQDLSVFSIEQKTNEDGICAAARFSVSPTGSYNTEESMLQALDIGYLRLPTTDHCRPRDSEVDSFVAFEANLKEDMWLHFHCRAGDGRTTTFMAMHDIIHNAPGDQRDVILKRQGPVKHGGIGGIDLTTVDKSPDRYDYPFLAERVEFMKKFYKYVCQARPGGFELTWSNWVNQNRAHG